MRSNFGRRAPKQPDPWVSPGALAAIGSAITITAIMVGGLWAVFQFAYANFIQPRLRPAVLHTSTEYTYVGGTSCCLVYEIATHIENRGHRPVFIHASMQTVGARQVEMPETLSSGDASEINNAYLASLGLNRPAIDLVDATVKYVTMRPQLPFLVISGGNLTPPRWRLSPGEVRVSRSVALVPLNFPLVSVRGALLVSHFSRDDLDWRWTYNQNTLEPIPLPWRKTRDKELNMLVDCARRALSGEQREMCVSKMRDETVETLDDLWTTDAQSYSQNYSIDFFALPSEAVSRR